MDEWERTCSNCGNYVIALKLNGVWTCPDCERPVSVSLEQHVTKETPHFLGLIE